MKGENQEARAAGRTLPAGGAGIVEIELVPKTYKNGTAEENRRAGVESDTAATQQQRQDTQAH